MEKRLSITDFEFRSRNYAFYSSNDPRSVDAILKKPFQWLTEGHPTQKTTVPVARYVSQTSRSLYKQPSTADIGSLISLDLIEIHWGQRNRRKMLNAGLHNWLLTVTLQRTPLITCLSELCICKVSLCFLLKVCNNYKEFVPFFNIAMSVDQRSKIEQCAHGIWATLALSVSLETINIVQWTTGPSCMKAYEFVNCKHRKSLLRLNDQNSVDWTNRRYSYL